jgi:hypothetical protein
MGLIKGFLMLMAALLLAGLAMLLVGVFTVLEFAFKIVMTFVVVAGIFYLLILEAFQFLFKPFLKRDR